MQTGGKFLVGSYRGKAASGCCDPRKAGEFGAENNRVRHRFPGVRHRLAEAGEAAFLSCSMMGDTATGKGPFHARATPQNPARKKEIRRETQTIKKTLPPVRKKPAFLVELYSGALVSSGHRSAPTEPAGETSWTLRGDHPTPARKLPQKSAQKKEFSEAIKRRASIAGGHPAGHYVAIVRGESQRITAIKKELHNGDAGAPKCAKLDT